MVPLMSLWMPPYRRPAATLPGHCRRTRRPTAGTTAPRPRAAPLRSSCFCARFRTHDDLCGDFGANPVATAGLTTTAGAPFRHARDDPVGTRTAC